MSVQTPSERLAIIMFKIVSLVFSYQKKKKFWVLKLQDPPAWSPWPFVVNQLKWDLNKWSGISACACDGKKMMVITSAREDFIECEWIFSYMAIIWVLWRLEM